MRKILLIKVTVIAILVISLISIISTSQANPIPVLPEEIIPEDMDSIEISYSEISYSDNDTISQFDTFFPTFTLPPMIKIPDVYNIHRSISHLYSPTDSIFSLTHEKSSSATLEVYVVKNMQNEKPIKNAEVSIKTNPFGAKLGSKYTDSNGYCVFTDLEPDDYYVSIKVTQKQTSWPYGTETIEKTDAKKVELDAGETEEVTIPLKLSVETFSNTMEDINGFFESMNSFLNDMIVSPFTSSWSWL